VWPDETYYTVRVPDIVRNDDGTKLSGLSRNQICIGVATDKKSTALLAIGIGKPSQKKVYEVFGKHIEYGATLIHDKEKAHGKLIKELALNSVAYASADLKNLADEDNPMNPVNQAHRILKKFLNAHSGFNRNDLQDYLNLFAFVSNPPDDLLEKVELVVDLTFRFSKLLRYRDFFSRNKAIQS
jgi:hypothetical protein